jgi:hypothetical protein
LTAQRFRRIALALEGAVEGAHMGHPDFRVDKRIFASLHTHDQFGMVKLTPDQQALFIEDHPGAFEPEAGAWGRSGCTRIVLKAADEEAVGEALTLAWQNMRRVLRKKCR